MQYVTAVDTARRKTTKSLTIKVVLSFCADTVLFGKTTM